MSAKIKVRAKIPDFSGRDDLTRMFNQMVGVEEPDKNVVLPKFSQYRSNLNKIAKTLKLFSSETFRKRFVEYDSHFEHIAIYVKQCEELIALIDSLSDDEKISRYVEIKSNNAIKNTILNCNLLKNHGANIEKIGEYREQFAKLETTDAEFPRLVSLAGVFIEQYPSSELHLLYVSKINFKTLWFDPRCSFDLKKFIVEMLHVVHKFSRAIFDLYSSPDIDVESFSRILVANLANLRSRIPRCEDAFNRIESSIGMLQNNFGRYYNTFIDTKNTGVFFEDFVMDIATDGTIEKTVTVSYKNPFPPSNCNLELEGALCLNATLRDWFRVYVPKGSQLIKMTGSEVEPVLYDESGKQVFEGFYGNKYPLYAQSSNRVSVQYTSPISPSSDYTLLLQKQPGTKAVEYQLFVNGKQQDTFDWVADKTIKLAL